MPPENGHPAEQSVTNERTPLLATSNELPVPAVEDEDTISKLYGTNGNDPKKPSTGPSPQRSSSHDDADKPLPKFQIALLCYCRLVEPIAFFSIFPFVNQMIWETSDLGQEDVGFYSGLIESLFSLTQMLLMIPWGRAADRLGRKPVLVFSLFGVSIATALFGFSKTIWQMIIFRCLAGVFAGTIVTVRAMISENSTQKTQARAFSFFAFTGNLGIFIGPLLGGALSEPAKQYPRAFGHIKFFHEYPYALPTIVTGCFGLTSAILAMLFVKETLPPPSSHPTSSSTAEGSDTTSHPTKPKPMTTLQLLRFPGVSLVLLIYSYAMLLAFAFTAVAPVFWFTPPDLGGYGFSPLQISIFLGISGLSQAIWLLLVFPPLHRRIGTSGILRWCCVAWPIFFVMGPLFNLMRRFGGTTGPWNTVFWVLLPINQVFGSGVSMAFTAVQLALNDISPNHHTLGTLNAIALTLTSGIRAVIPGSITPIYAIGVGHHILGGHLVWVIIIALALGLTGIVWGTPIEKWDKGERVMDRAEDGEGGE